MNWFGNGVKMERTDEGNIRYVKVSEPQSLCDIIKADIAEMQKLYEE
ncbi:MAG: hypothetical protein ACI4RO_03020 [Candidatus Scatosoma sp.]